MRFFGFIFLLPFFGIYGMAQVYYPGEDAFHILDMKGDATIQEVENVNIPLADGARVLDIKGDHVIGLVAAADAMQRGILMALYREMAPKDADADGILLFDADYPMDISEAHNVKQNRRQVWLEVDNDSGLHFRGVNENGEEALLSTAIDAKLVGDAWPETGWLWQKVAFGDGHIRGKCWEAHLMEPEEWDIEVPCDVKGGRFGFRIGSGHIQLAFYAVQAEDVPLQTPPPLFVYPPKDVIADTGMVPVWLYTNFTPGGEREITLAVHHEGTRVAGISRTLSFPEGPSKTEFVFTSHPSKREERSVRIPPNPPRGQWTISADTGTERDAAVLQVVDTALIEASFQSVENAVSAVVGLFSEPDAIPEEVKVVLDVARSHTDFGRELLKEGRVDEAMRTLNYGVNALNELRGPKGDVLPEIGAQIASLPSGERHPAQGKRGGEGIRVVYDPAWRVHFGKPVLESQSMVMGRKYTVKVPATILGVPSERDLIFHAELKSPYGHRTPASASCTPEPPTSSWEGGKEYWLEFTLDIIADDAKPLTPEPLVLDEYHDLVLRAADPESRAPVLLANNAGQHHDDPGTGYNAAKVYVSSTPVEIRGFTPENSPMTSPRREVASISIHEGAPEELNLVFTALAANGETLFQELVPINTGAAASAEYAFTWSPQTAGKVDLHMAVLRGNTPVTEARREVFIAPPYPVRISKRKETLHREDTEYVTLLPVSVDGDKEAAVSVYANGRLVGSGKPDVIECEPWFGYYDVVVRGSTWRYIERIVATVVTTAGTDLVVNGEPFLVKGVNVHGMDGRSPERTRVMMRILKERNFNMLRSDYPPPWQMDMAYEMNLVYTVLAPFSCASTKEVFQRQDGPPLVTAREISRAMVDRYAEYPGVLLWNSCNEIVDELDSFLISLYPVYVCLDPYRRPVHYANLYAQDAVRGQDLVGLNYYFGVGERALDRHATIQRGITRAHALGLPVFYNEFNSWYGAIPGTGVEALHDLFEWGNEQKMTGGIFYFRFNSDRHPGIFDDDYNTHKVIDDALHSAFDDARVMLVNTESKRAVRIENPRKFTLRQVGIAFEGAPEQPLDDLPPGEMIEVDLPPAVTGLEVRGVVHYVTHYGFTGGAPFTLFTPTVPNKN